MLFAAGIAHCGLNIDNVVLKPISGQLAVQVTGFEDSQQCDGVQQLSRRLTRSEYTAPEACGGTYSTTADLWSFGSVVQWLLTGNVSSRLQDGKLPGHGSLESSSM